MRDVNPAGNRTPFESGGNNAPCAVNKPDNDDALSGEGSKTLPIKAPKPMKPHCNKWRRCRSIVSSFMVSVALGVVDVVTFDSLQAVPHDDHRSFIAAPDRQATISASSRVKLQSFT